ncbi:MAG: hypothetical protein KDI21_21610, partial [Halieaceae bacterium]|nr:hypothetical protein [Halieaceae bacterium]
MTGPLTVIMQPFSQLLRALPPTVWAACALALLAPFAQALVDDVEQELARLAGEREMLAQELDQFKITVKMIHTEDTPPEQSSNPAVRKLALEMVSLRERLVAVTEREVTLLQEQIIAARQL